MDISVGMRRRKGTHPEEVGNNDQREVEIKFDSSAANAPGLKNPQEQPPSEQASRLSTSPTVKRASLWQYMIPFSPRLFGASIFAARIPFVRAADAGDEFTNNFVTDLAPLLALFGERVATQFMSESFTIADSIIFAVAPLGIMTAMVGAIRVGGPNELRAIIGRAKESRSTVELELMSSTSTEVCELWNGDGIVRVLGKSPIIELIYVVPDDDNPDDNISEQTPLHNMWQDDLGIYDFDSALNQKGEKTLLKRISSSAADSSGPFLYSDLAPNLSLNMGGQTVPVFELWIVAVFGMMLQLGVLLFAGFSVLISHRSSSFKKDGATPQPYAFPLMAVGTCSLVLGMFLCSHIIDRSTMEETWEFAELKGASIKVAWLQQGGEVNDQLFDSHALFALKNRNQTSILRRFVQAIINCSIFTIKWCAYFVHFTGVLSSRHYLLGAIVAKTCLQAHRQLMRDWYPQFLQPLKSTFGSFNLVLRRSLVSLANRFGGLSYMEELFRLRAGIVFSFFDSEAWFSYLRNISLESKPSIRRSRKPLGIKGQSSLVVLAIAASLCGFFGQFLGLRLMHWSATVSQLVITVIMTVLRAWVRRNLIHKPTNKKLEAGYELDWMAQEISNCSQWTVVTWGFDRPNSFESSLATKLVTARRRLGMLSRWPSKWLKTIDSTKKAIEGVMNFLFSNEGVTLDKNYWLTRGTFEWKILVEVVDKSNQCHLEEVILNMRRSRLLDGPWGPWRASTSEIDAVLGLWMLHFREIDRRQDGRNDAQNGEEDSPQRARLILRTLGLCDNIGRINFERWITRGSDFVKVDDLYCSKLNKNIGLSGHVVGIPQRSASSIKAPLLGVISNTPLENICGQTILAEFISSMAQHINIGAELFPRVGNKIDKKEFGMGTVVLSGLAKEIEKAGLANTEEAYMTLVPVLFKSGNLPKFDDTKFFGLFAETAKSHIEIGEFEQAEWVLLWLFHCAETSVNALKEKNEWMKAGQIYLDLCQACSTILQSDSNGYTDEIDKRIALLCEDAFSAVCERSQFYDTDHAERLPDTLNLIAQCMINVLGDIPKKILDAWKDKHAPEPSKCLTSRSVDEQLLEAAENGVVLLVQRLLEEGANVEFHDSYLRTPLILASLSGHTGVVKRLLEKHAQATAQDYLGQTPLHHASAKCHTQVVQTLLLHHGPLDIPDKNGETALDLAVKNNAGEVVDLLLFYGATDIDGKARRLSREGSMKGSEARVNLKLTEKPDEEALYWAIWKGSRSVIETLVGGGIGIKWRDGLMQTPLHIAASKGSVDVIRILQKNNADLEVKEKSGKTALHLASMNGHTETHNVLVNFGGNINAVDDEGQSPAHYAASNGHINIVKHCLDEGTFDREAKDNNGRIVLHHAGCNGHTETVRLLLDRGFDKEAKSNFGWTALHYAAMNGHTETVRLLLDRGVDRESKGNFGWTALHPAAWNGHTETVRLLLDRGVDRESKDEDNKTAFHRAAGNGHTETVRLLLDRGVDRESKGGLNQTALHHAARNGHTETVRLLLDRGVDRESKGGFNQTALHHAAENGHTETVRLLLDRGVDRESKGNIGWTALHYAAMNGHTETVRLLLDRGVDREAKDKNGRIVLHDAAENGHIETVRLLLDRGVDRESKGGFDRTALHYAAMNGHAETVRLLLDRGVDRESKDEDNKTALHRAAENGHTETARLLLDRGVDRESKGGFDRTALHYAAKNGHTETARLLLDRGVDKNLRDVGNNTAQDVARDSNHLETAAMIEAYA